MGEHETKSTKATRHRHEVVLWWFALAFVGFALRPAWYWAQYLRYLLRVEGETWRVFGPMAVTEVGPLVVALGLVAFLWKTFGAPVSLARERSPENAPRDEAEGQDLPPTWKHFASQGEIQRRAEQAGAAGRFWRDVVWVVIFTLLIGASGWGLFSFACSFVVAGFSGESPGKLVAQGFAPLAGMIVLAALAWLFVGPPFVRQRGAPQRKASDSSPRSEPDADEGPSS